jgi:hypothetical protein
VGSGRNAICFFYVAQGSNALGISNASGRSVITVDPGVVNRTGFSWSLDGRWLSYVKGQNQLATVKPGEPPIILSKASPALGEFQSVQWSPAGDWIVYPVADGFSAISPDGETVRKLTTRKLLVFGFSKDSRQLFGISAIR